MQLPKKSILALVALIAVAVPAVVVAAAGEDGALTQFQYFTYSNGKDAEKAATNSTNWKDVPGLERNYGTFDASIGTISAELKQGSAKFRIVDEEGDVLTEPKAAKFVEGTGWFAFPIVKNAQLLQLPEGQWEAGRQAEGRARRRRLTCTSRAAAPGKEPQVEAAGLNIMKTGGPPRSCPSPTTSKPRRP